MPVNDTPSMIRVRKSRNTTRTGKIVTTQAAMTVQYTRISTSTHSKIRIFDKDKNYTGIRGRKRAEEIEGSKLFIFPDHEEVFLPYPGWYDVRITGIREGPFACAVESITDAGDGQSYSFDTGMRFLMEDGAIIDSVRILRPGCLW